MAVNRLAPAPSTVTRDVSRGDSVWKIAQGALEQQLNRTPTNGEINELKNQIIDLNGLRAPYTIQPGQVLKLPADAPAQKDRPPTWTPKARAERPRPMPPPPTVATPPPAAAQTPAKTTPPVATTPPPPEKGTARKIGEAIVNGSKATQGFIDRALGKVEAAADRAAALQAESGVVTDSDGGATVHFVAGFLSGAASAITGIGSLVGGALELTDADVRADASAAVSNVVHHPGDVAVGIGHSVRDAFAKDPAHAAGQAASLVVGAALTVGKVAKVVQAARAGRAAADVAEGVELVGAAKVPKLPVVLAEEEPIKPPALTPKRPPVALAKEDPIEPPAPTPKRPQVEVETRPASPVTQAAEVRIDGASAAGKQSIEFQRTNRIEGGQRIADGYVDGGRGMKVGDDGTVSSSREVIVVDRARDPALRAALSHARALRRLPEAERARALSRYVDRFMATKDPQGIEAAVTAWESTRTGREVLLGDVQALGGGVCRHRALLFKVLGDEAGLDVSLVRGRMVTPGGSGAHAWDEVRLANGGRAVVDPMNPQPTHAAVPLNTTDPKLQSVLGQYWSLDKTPMYPGPTP